MHRVEIRNKPKGFHRSWEESMWTPIRKGDLAGRKTRAEKASRETVLTLMAPLARPNNGYDVSFPDLLLDVTLCTYYLALTVSVLAVSLHPLPFTTKSPFQRCFDGTNGFRTISPAYLEPARRRVSADSIGQLRRGAARNCSRRGTGR